MEPPSIPCNRHRRRAGTAPAALALCRELPRAVDDIEHDNRAGDELHESDVGKPVDDEFPRARYPVAFPDPFGVGR